MTVFRFARAASALMIGASALAFAASSAHATDGYLQEGVSPADQATGGAGVAEGRDALTLGNNPAGLMDVGRQFNLDLTLFAPSRGYDASGTFLVAPGSHDSSYDLFGIPAMAYSQPIDGDSSWGVALYGAGGMNTDYKISSDTGAFCPPGGSGAFCGGKAGVNLEQAFLTVGYAHRFGSVSIGVAPILAIQQFSAQGLGFFAANGFSASPGNMTNNGASYSVGGGLRAGAEWHATDTLRLGLSATTPIWASNFTKYSGLFAGGGNFDIPATIAVGLAYDVAPTFTLLADYKHIFYGEIPSVGRSSLGWLSGALFGASNGPGFGWRDVDVISIGAEWRATKDLTLRAGYSHNTDPITSADVMLNILAPGVITDHFSAGATYALNKNNSIDFATVYAPEQSVSGMEYLPGLGANTASNIKIHLSEFEATLGWTYKFDTVASAAPISARY
jgi:long-chain fatty acid transport protein